MRFLFFHGLAGFCGAWLEGTGYLPRKAGRILDKEFRRQFQDSSWRDQMYWNSAQLLRPELWHQITRPLTATSVLKLNSSSLFPLTKRVARILKPEVAIIWPLLPHLVRRFIRTTIQTSVPLLYPPGWGYGVQIAWPTF